MQEKIKKVAEYHTTIGLSVKAEPSGVLKQRELDNRLTVIEGAVKDLEVAAHKGNIAEVLFSCASLQYNLLQAVLELGMQDVFEDAFEELHRSNMSKFCKSTAEAQNTVYKYMGRDVAVCYKKVGQHFVIRDHYEKLLPGIHFTPPKMKLILEALKQQKKNEKTEDLSEDLI